MQTPAIPFSSPSSPAPLEEQSNASQASEDGGTFGAALSAQSQDASEQSTDGPQPGTRKRGDAEAPTSRSSQAPSSASDDASASTSTEKTSQTAKDAAPKEGKQGEHESAAKSSHESHTHGKKETTAKEAARGVRKKATPSDARVRPEAAAKASTRPSAQTVREANAESHAAPKTSTPEASHGRPSTRHAGRNKQTSTATTAHAQPAAEPGKPKKETAQPQQQTGKPKSNTPSSRGAAKSEAAAKNTRRSTPLPVGESKKIKRQPARRATPPRVQRSGQGQTDRPSQTGQPAKRAAQQSPAPQSKTTQQAAARHPSAASTASDTTSPGMRSKPPQAGGGAGDTASTNNASTTGQDARYGARGRQQRARHASSQARPNPPGHQPGGPEGSNTASERAKPSSPAVSWEKLSTDAKFDADGFRDKIVQASAEGGRAARTTSTPGNARVPPFVTRSRTLAWLRTTGHSPIYTNGKEGWQKLEMQLKNGDGLMTVQTHRSKDRMAISVGFSDARMRAQAAASATQLQELLQSQYDTNIDFSLMGDGTNHADQHTPSDQAHRRTDASGLTAEAAESESHHASSSRRALAAGAQHEWIG